jgi:pectate lyase
MGRSKRLVLGSVLALVAATAATSFAHNERDLGRDVLAPNDGWASEGTGTTGGSAAVDTQVYTVTNRAELIAALNNGVIPPPPNDISSANPSNEQKIIYVDDTIDANVDADNAPLACENYFRPDATTGEIFSYDIPLGSLIERLNGTSMFETGTLVDHTLGHDRGNPHGGAVSLLEEYNAITDPDIVDATGTTWTPTLFLDVDRTKKVPNLVRKNAGPFDTFCGGR